MGAAARSPRPAAPAPRPSMRATSPARGPLPRLARPDPLCGLCSAPDPRLFLREARCRPATRRSSCSLLRARPLALTLARLASPLAHALLFEARQLGERKTARTCRTGFAASSTCGAPPSPRRCSPDTPPAGDRGSAVFSRVERARTGDRDHRGCPVRRSRSDALEPRLAQPVQILRRERHGLRPGGDVGAAGRDPRPEHARPRGLALHGDPPLLVAGQRRAGRAACCRPRPRGARASRSRRPRAAGRGGKSSRCPCSP